MGPGNCRLCESPLKGRSDKKFCDDSCRNNYNNRLKAKTGQSAYIRNINNALLKNHQVLQSLFAGPEDTVKISAERLQRAGFLFRYFTDTFTTRNGKTYFYCYDYGYLPLENGWYLVVKRRERD